MTPQEQMKAKLTGLGIPYKQIDVFGSQIIVTAWSEAAANKWHSVLRRFTASRRPVRSVDNNKVNMKTNLNPSFHYVWLVGGTINV